MLRRARIGRPAVIAPVRRATATVATAAVVTHGVRRRGDRREDRATGGSDRLAPVPIRDRRRRSGLARPSGGPFCPWVRTSEVGLFLWDQSQRSDPGISKLSRSPWGVAV